MASRDRSNELSRLAHEMSNSLAYVATNLFLLAEHLEGDPPNASLVKDALEGADRLADQVRALRHLTWSEQPEPPVPPEDTTSSGGLVLVIDDESAILAAVKRALRDHDVVPVSAAEEAWTLLQDQSFDLVLCDLVMPEGSGIDLYERMAERDPATAERFVFMTGGGFTDRTRSFLASSPNPVLHKPFDAKTLRWMVSKHLEKR